MGFPQLTTIIHLHAYCRETSDKVEVQSSGIVSKSSQEAHRFVTVQFKLTIFHAPLITGNVTYDEILFPFLLPIPLIATSIPIVSATRPTPFMDGETAAAWNNWENR